MLLEEREKHLEIDYIHIKFIHNNRYVHVLLSSTVYAHKIG